MNSDSTVLAQSPVATDRPARGRSLNPTLLVAAALVAGGGFVHAREWSDTYRHVAASISGSALVRVGFPIDAVVSFVVAAALVYLAVRPTRGGALVVAAALGFQLASLATLVLTRTGSVVGWMEHVWTPGANQARALELGALVALIAELLVQRTTRARPTRT